MSLSATLFGRDSVIFQATNIMGLGIPGLLDKWFGTPDTPAQRLGDISRQTSKEAEPRVKVYGRVRPIGGNLMQCQTPVKRMVKEKVDSGGKGGSKKKTQKVEHVFRTYAIGVCQGPITRFVRIWRNNQLVYDARGNEWGERNNPVFLKSFKLYTGAWSQLPDPSLEQIWGVGSVPAYRGTAYMVAIDEDLTNSQGMVPQWLFEVERAEYIASTSKPYKFLDRHTIKTYSLAYEISSRTVVHREIKNDFVESQLAHPDDVFIYNTVHNTYPIELLQASLAVADDVLINNTIHTQNTKETIYAENPYPENVSINRSRVQLPNREILSASNVLAENISVTEV